MRVTLEDIKQFYRKVIIPFHAIERDMTLPLLDHRPDNDAEHSWSLSALSIALAPEVDKGLDVGLVSIFASVHDLVEVYAGDTSVWSDTNILAGKKKREDAALVKLKKDFPKFSTLFKYVEKYEARDSSEAQFVYALDKFINLLNIVEDEGYFYREKYKITKSMYDQQLKGHRNKAHSHPAVAKYYDEMRELFDKQPEHFYQAKRS